MGNKESRKDVRAMREVLTEGQFKRESYNNREKEDGEASDGMEQ